MPACGTTNQKIALSGPWYARCLIAALLLGIGVARFLPLLRGRVLVASLTPLCDQWHVNMPFAFLLSEALHAGRLPVWTDRIGGGYPLLALGEAGVLYPPHLLLYRLLPPVPAYNLNVILAVATAAATMYLLCRDLGRSRAASLLAGLAFSWSGYFLLHLVTLHSAQAASWAPLLLLCVRRAVRAGRAWAWVPAGVVLALQITTGYPQIAYYSLVAAALLAVGELSGAAAVRRARGAVLGGLVLFGVAGGLSAAHWLPGLELTRQSGRSGGLRYEAATRFSYPPVNLLTFVAPYALGNPATGGEQGFSERGHFWDNGYVGLAPLALALLAAAAGIRCDRRVRFFSLLLLFSLLIVLGRHTPFFSLLWHTLPGMSFFRFPSRFMAIADLSLAVLAAYGVDGLRARLRCAACGPSGGTLGAPASGRARDALLLGVLFSATLLDLGIYAARFHRFTDAAAWLAPPQTARLLQPDRAPANPGDAAALIRNPKSEIRNPKSFYALGYADLELRAGRRARGWMGDLTPFLEQKEALAPNGGALYSLSCLNAFGGLDTRRAMAVYALLADDRTLAGRWVPIRYSFPRTLALLGVTHVVTPYVLAMPGLREVRIVRGPEPVRVYAVEGARPRVWIPDAVRPTADWRESLAALRDAGATAVEGAGTGVTSAGGEVLSAETGPDSARARVRMRGPGVVVHNQRLYPGWQATVDGKPVALYPANCLMQAAPVPAGEHTVEFRFEPSSYIVGRSISLMALVVLAAAAGFTLRRRLW